MDEHYTRVICDICGAGFASDSRLRAHVASHEKGSYPCEECGKHFSKMVSKQLHIEMVHLKVKRNKCKYCDETFRDYYQKEKHALAVHGIKMREYKCGFCPKVFVRGSNLRSHERLCHIRAETFSCEVCDYKTHHKNTLTRHMVCHSDEKKFQCQVCKKSYARARTLKEHMRIHNNDRRYACQYCGRAFVQKCSLKGHLKTHHREHQNGDSQIQE
ncbi:zinc finger protein 626-like [Ostrinia furnacalis]|uniref:zinc finger protein 626-like n=1 Tax=Ostrinia furnacalis TaxID=93504 RepID=UPI00103AE2D6|nr:zinc finger protein 626-like [Ostrinia furnacalis]